MQHATINEVCSCGETESHTIARRVTADGKHVCLWDDGTLTWSLGAYIRGGMQPRTNEQRAKARRVGWLVLGEVCLYNANEVSELIAAARWAVERDGLPGTVRARLWSQRRRAALPKPEWRVQSTDRNGKTYRARVVAATSRCVVGLCRVGRTQPAGPLPRARALHGRAYRSHA